MMCKNVHSYHSPFHLKSLYNRCRRHRSMCFCSYSKKKIIKMVCKNVHSYHSPFHLKSLYNRCLRCRSMCFCLYHKKYKLIKMVCKNVHSYRSPFHLKSLCHRCHRHKSMCLCLYYTQKIKWCVKMPILTTAPFIWKVCTIVVSVTNHCVFVYITHTKKMIKWCVKMSILTTSPFIWKVSTIVVAIADPFFGNTGGSVATHKLAFFAFFKRKKEFI